MFQTIVTYSSWKARVRHDRLEHAGGGRRIVAGLSAGSVAVVAFGLDSSVEVLASLVVVWELRGANRSGEHRAVHLIGLGYIVVGLYVARDAFESVQAAHRPSASPVGIAVLAGTVVVMLALAAGKLRVGRALASPTVLADSRFSLIDGGLAAAVLVGLVLTAAFGWWWADAVLAGLIAVLALGEGLESVFAHRREPPDR